MSERSDLLAVAKFASATIQKTLTGKPNIVGIETLDDDELRELVKACNSVIDSALLAGIGRAPVNDVNLISGLLGTGLARRD